MENFWDLVKGVPWWVHLVFIYLLITGIRSIKPRRLSIGRLIVLPVFFVAWSLYYLYLKCAIGLFSLISIWIIFLAIGTYLGFKEVQSWRIQVDRKRREIIIPANYSTLILMIVIFILRFFWGYFYATHANISYWMYFADTVTSAAITGFFIGRVWLFFQRYFHKS